MHTPRFHAIATTNVAERLSLSRSVASEKPPSITVGLTHAAVVTQFFYGYPAKLGAFGARRRRGKKQRNSDFNNRCLRPLGHSSGLWFYVTWE
jgi:hypothetical protein